MTYKILILVGSIMLTSCATQKKDGEARELSKVGVEKSLVKGKSSKADVIKLLGTPEMVNSNSERTEQWVYSKSETEWNSKYGDIGLGILSFVGSSLLGGFGSIGGSKSSESTKMKTLEIYFNKQGFLNKYAFSYSKI